MFTRCGIDLPTSHLYLIDVEGIDRTSSLLLLSTKDIVELAKRCRFAPTPFALGAVQQKKLEALRSWVLDYQLCGSNISQQRHCLPPISCSRTSRKLMRESQLSRHKCHLSSRMTIGLDLTTLWMNISRKRLEPVPVGCKF